MARLKFTLSAPGRVNLLGEHTDYSGGFVMPMAISFATQATVAWTGTADEYVFLSSQFAGETRLKRGDAWERQGLWSDYPVGVLNELREAGFEPPAFTMEIEGAVPVGAGLSSSASVEVSACMAMLAWAGWRMQPREIALLCQRAENRFVGSPCGIMDQFVSVAATHGHALVLNTRDLHYELVPMNTGDFANACVVVCNSQVKHSVASGEYGLRRRQVEEGQAALRAAFPELRDLGDATWKELEAAKGAMSHEAYLRCRHIVSENARVAKAADAMCVGDARRMGELMIAGHASERDDFECSCDEIDFLVDTAVNLPGCFGARLTGGGFGGCTVNLVKRDSVEEFSRALKVAYEQRFGINPATYLCEAMDGAYARNRALMEQVAKDQA
jgi:galactokinase